MQRPGAAERDEREVGRIVPALDGDDAKRTQHLGVDDVDDAAGIDSAKRSLGRRPVELDAAGKLRPASRPSSRFASVTVPCVPPRP